MPSSMSARSMDTSATASVGTGYRSLWSLYLATSDEVDKNPNGTSSRPSHYQANQNKTIPLLLPLPSDALLLEHAKQMHDIVYPTSASSTVIHNSGVKARHDSSKPLCEFAAGSEVMLRKPPDPPSPYTVIRRNRRGAYLLQDNTGVTLLDKFRPNQLKLVAPLENSAPDSLPPDEYEIDEILNYKGPANKHKYLVHWKGYAHSKNQWISAKDIHAPKLVKRYWDLLKQPPSSSPSSS